MVWLLERPLISRSIHLARLVPLQFSSIKQRHLAEPQKSTSSIKELAFWNEELFTFFNFLKKIWVHCLLKLNILFFCFILMESPLKLRHKGGAWFLKKYTLKAIRLLKSRMIWLCVLVIGSHKSLLRRILITDYCQLINFLQLLNRRKKPGIF